MNRLDLQPVRRSLGDLAYESLRNSIISLELEPGLMVSEFELATQLGVSRTPVREALRRLMLEGFIDVMPQRGARIALISQRKVEETRFVRECLEVSVFQQIASQWDSTNSVYQTLESQIRQSLHEQKLALSDHSSLRFLQLDEEFHRTVLESSKNDTLLTIVTNMRAHLNRVRFLSLQELGTMEKLVHEHEQILESITAGDSTLVGKVLTNHLGKLATEFPRIVSQHPTYFVP